METVQTQSRPAALCTQHLQWWAMVPVLVAGLERLSLRQSHSSSSSPQGASPIGAKHRYVNPGV